MFPVWFLSFKPGHYISDVYDCKTKQWTSYDDSTATKVTACSRPVTYYSLTKEYAKKTLQSEQGLA